MLMPTKSSGFSGLSSPSAFAPETAKQKKKKIRVQEEK
jgi:hypothetical protein